MEKNPIRFAVVGCGMLARSQHLPNIAASPNMVLKVCCDLSEANLTSCQKEFNPESVTNNFHAAIQNPQVDAICLATTEKLRLPVIAAAAKARKPVYVEKPLARSLEEMLQIQAVVRESGIAFCIGHNRRSAPAMIAAHNIFRQHTEHQQPCPWRFERGGNRPGHEHDGVPTMAIRINDDWHSWKDWVFDPEQAPHGPMLFEMTHFTDLCNWFLNDEPVRVTALQHNIANHGVIVQYRNGALATITMSSNGTFGYPKELYEIMAYGGLVAVDYLVEIRTAGIGRALTRQTFPMLKDRHPQVGEEGGFDGWYAKKQAACEEASAQGDPQLQFTAEPDKGHAAHLEAFVAQLRGGPEVCGVDDAVLAGRVAWAAIEAASTQKVVDL